MAAGQTRVIGDEKEGIPNSFENEPYQQPTHQEQEKHWNNNYKKALELHYLSLFGTT